VRNIIKAFGGRYIHQGKVNTVICPMFFKQMLLTKNYKEQANKELLNNLRYFFEVMQRLDTEDKTLIYEKYFKYASIQPSKNKSPYHRDIYNLYVVKQLSNEKHALMMKIQPQEYRRRLDKALTNYINILIDIKEEEL
jgi:hypothetical protein